MAQWAWNGFKSCPHMGQEYPGWKGSQSEHNCVTDTKKSAKTCQKWPKIAQTMAIFHHKWLILWRKKIIFINIQLPMGSGQLLIPFGYLEVPLPAACSLVRRALWNRPAPFGGPFGLEYCLLAFDTELVLLGTAVKSHPHIWDMQFPRSKKCLLPSGKKFRCHLKFFLKFERS